MDREAEIAAVAGLKRGEVWAFDAVYEEYRARVFSFALRLLGRRAVAEEIAQETWMRLAARAGRLNDDTRLGSWLFTVARNLCISSWRASAHDTAFVSDDGLQALPDGRRPSPLQAAEASELRGRLDRALARLAVDDREVLLLVGVEGLTPSEAAAVCGVRATTLRKRLQRARERLAGALWAVRMSTNEENGARHELVAGRR
jgi:RNA polymerase sigma-70 factor (ECF subfamily)